MATPGKRLTILDEQEVADIYAHPQFLDADRQVYFALNDAETAVMRSLRSMASRMHFMLLLGFFKAKSMFFTLDENTVQTDIAYLKRRYFPNDTETIRFAFSRRTLKEHQDHVLHLLDYRRPDEALRRMMLGKMLELFTLHTKPLFVFRELLVFLEHQRIAIPRYSTLQKMMTDAIKEERQRLDRAMSAELTEDARTMLRDLLKNEDRLYELTLLKKQPKDFKYGETKDEVQRLGRLAPLYEVTNAVLPRLEVSNENLKYYASLVSFYTPQKLRNMPDVLTCLYLLCFIKNRFEKGKDNLAQCFIHLVNDFLHGAKKHGKELVYAFNVEGHEHLPQVGQILRLLVDKNVPQEAFKEQALSLIPEEKIPFVADFVAGIKMDEKRFRWQFIELTKNTWKKNIRPVFKTLEFRSQRLEDPISVAMHFLREHLEKSRPLTQEALDQFPQDVIPGHWQKYVKPNGVLNPHLYEFMVYRLCAKGLEAGDVFIPKSNRYKSFDDDLVSRDLMNKKDRLIEKIEAPLLKQPVESILDYYKSQLEPLLAKVNQRVVNGENKDIKKVRKGDAVSWRLPYHKKEEHPNHPIYKEFRQVEISDLLYFVNNQTQFFDAFTHILDRYLKKGADNERVCACISAMGTNHGLSLMAEMSDMTYNDLSGTVNNFIRLENLREANDAISNAISKLPIFAHYHIDGKDVHASADGQKYETRIHTINSRYSPKYFGLQKGVTSYSMVANHIPIIAKIIGANEHESHHVFDLLFQNSSEIDPKKLSVDLHGINHVNFFFLDVFGYVFAPRFTNIDHKSKLIFGFQDMDAYADFVLKPVRQIDKELIISEWENILRILISLGTRTISQCTIVRKLSSYLRVNRTKKALWELDNIVRSLYVLNFIDSVEFRHNVQKALNRGEAYHKLRRAVFFARAGKFHVNSEHEQELWSECSRLIANAIIYYNTFILSEFLERLESEGRFEEADLVKRVSPVGWRHVNLYGMHRFHRQMSDAFVNETLDTLWKDPSWIHQEPEE